ncbi:MAG: NIPSNAP family protein [Actinomycetota bacterium]|nr:NIPSNAP family protein [Actinomycetota bacterium]
MELRVVELRQYTLKPGRTDDLIDLFDRELVETQEACGMWVLGQFRDLDRPDRFVWLRGFPDMDTRREALTAFYTGPVWKEHGPAANDAMIDSDDVLLLEPTAFRLPGARPEGAVAPTELTISVYDGRPPVDGGEPTALLRTLAAENTFPALPVRRSDVTVRIDRGPAPAGPVQQTIRARSTGRSLLR